MSNVLEQFLKEDYEKWGPRNYLHEKKGDVFVPITYGAFIENVNYLATYLIEKGFAEKNIGIYGPNSIEWMISDIAIMCYVGCGVGFSKDWSYDNVVYSIKKSELSALIYDERQNEIMDRIKKEFPDLTYISVQNDFAACLEEGKRLSKGLFTLEGRNGDIPAKVVFTSGTTSFPKAVLLSVNNVFSGWKSLGRRITVDIEDTCYLFLPLNHTYGSIYNFIYSVVFGYEIYLAGSTKEMAQEMMAIHPTLFSGVPLVFARFYEASKAMNIPLGTLLGGRMKYLFCGGAKLTPEIRKAYADEGMYMMNAYALSETSSGFSIDYPGEEDMESVGTLFEDVDAKVIDPDEEGYGELAIKGSNIFLGYFNDEEATKAAFNEEGYFLTGDIGTIKNNHVYLKGRKDTRITLSNGENISTKRIEERVKEVHESIVAVKVYMRGDLLCTDIYVNDSNAPKDAGEWENLIEKVNGNVSKFERIGKYNIISSSQMLK